MPVNDWCSPGAANGTIASELTPTNTWASVNNALVISDAAAATTNLTTGTYSRYLGLGLNTFLSTVPVGAVITGIQMRIRHADANGYAQLVQAFFDRGAQNAPVDTPSEKKPGIGILSPTISTQFLGGSEDMWGLGEVARDDLDTVLNTLRLVYLNDNVAGTAVVQVYYAQARVWYYIPGKMRVKIAGEWVDAQPQVKVAGVWRGVNTVYIKRNGVWEAQ